MRLFQSLGLGFAAAHSVNDQLAASVGGTKLCGYFSGDTVRLEDSIELG